MRSSHCAVSKWSSELFYVDQTWMKSSWAWSAWTLKAILKSSTREPSLFSDWNKKIGFLGPRVHPEGWNLRNKYIWCPKGIHFFFLAFAAVYGLCAVRKFSIPKWSYLLMDWGETRVNWSWPICAGTTMAVFGYATRGPSLFSDRNEKMGPDGAMVHVEGWNLRTYYISAKNSSFAS